jgi:hypothetical protein
MDEKIVVWNFEENLEVLLPWVDVEKFGRLVGW